VVETVNSFKVFYAKRNVVCIYDDKGRQWYKVCLVVVFYAYSDKKIVIVYIKNI